MTVSIDTTEERWSIQREQLANLGGGWRHVAWTTGAEMRDDLRRYTGCRAVKITQRNIRTVTVFDGDELSGDRITKENQ